MSFYLYKSVLFDGLFGFFLFCFFAQIDCLQVLFLFICLLYSLFPFAQVIFFSPCAFLVLMRRLLFFQFFSPPSPRLSHNPGMFCPKEILNTKRINGSYNPSDLCPSVCSVLFFSLIPVQHSHITQSWHRPSGRRLSLDDVTDGLCFVSDGQLGL